MIFDKKGRCNISNIKNLDVALWFAKNAHNDYLTIYDIDDKNKKCEYFCPVCSSNVIPKGIKEDRKMSPHFAHRDASKCSTESLIHWCYKNNFLIEGGSFTLVDRDESIIGKYVCKEIQVEKSHSISGKTYKPDITVITTTGETIYFEINYKNKKKPEDYINLWLGLNNPVIEVDVKKLLQLNPDATTTFIFKPLFYNGKCYARNIKRKKTVQNIIELKENAYKKNPNVIATEIVNKLDWFWKSISNYRIKNCDIEEVFYLLDYLIENLDSFDKDLIEEVLAKSKCSNILDDFVEYKSNIMSIRMNSIIDNYKWYHYNIDDNWITIGVVGTSFSSIKWYSLTEKSLDHILNDITNYLEENKIPREYILTKMKYNVTYQFPALFNNKEIYLSVDNRDFNKKYGVYKSLDRYDFIKANERLISINDKITNFVEETLEKLINNINENFLPNDIKHLKITSPDINIEIQKILYPLIYLIEHTDEEVINIILNPSFTIGGDGRTQRWLIEDFLQNLHLLKISNISNHRNNMQGVLTVGK